jgi:hypothetical protein
MNGSEDPPAAKQLLPLPHGQPLGFQNQHDKSGVVGPGGTALSILVLGIIAAA